MTLPPAHHVAQLLGLERTRGKHRYAPCPACNATPTREDRRGPLIVRDGFLCVRCGARGPTLELISLRINGSRSDALRWLRDRHDLPELPQAAPAPPTRVPEAELRALFRASTRADQEPYLLSRGITPRDAWRIPPGFHAPWYPPFFARHFPVVVPAFNGHGQLRGLHGIAVDRDTAPRKTTWPRGVDSEGLLFACPAALEWLRGGPAPPIVLIVEGVTDFLHAAGLRELPVLGLESGSAPALALPSWHPHGVAVEAMDPDAAGDRYRHQIRKHLPDHIPLRSLAPA